jgi:hypothetical protein
MRARRIPSHAIQLGDEMTAQTLFVALKNLQFGDEDYLLLSIDRGVRDYLVRALKQLIEKQELTRPQSRR